MVPTHFQVQCRRDQMQAFRGPCDPFVSTRLRCSFAICVRFVQPLHLISSAPLRCDMIVPARLCYILMIFINVLDSRYSLVSWQSLLPLGFLRSDFPVPPSGNQSERGWLLCIFMLAIHAGTSVSAFVQDDDAGHFGFKTHPPPSLMHLLLFYDFVVALCGASLCNLS